MIVLLKKVAEKTHPIWNFLNHFFHFPIEKFHIDDNSIRDLRTCTTHTPPKFNINTKHPSNENPNIRKPQKRNPNKDPAPKHDPQNGSFTGPVVVAAPVHVNVTGAHASPIPGGHPRGPRPRPVCKIDSGPRRAPPAPAPSPGPPPGSTTRGARVTLERGAALGLLISRWDRSIFWIYRFGGGFFVSFIR